MPEDLLNQNTDGSTGQENKKEDPKGTPDAMTEMMKAVMSRLDTIEASVKASKETPKDVTPEPKSNEKTMTFEEAMKLIKQSSEESVNAFKNVLQEENLRRQLDELVANVPEENRDKAETIRKYVKNPADAIKEIIDNKLTVPKVIDYRTAINSGMTEAEFLASTGLMKNMGLTSENLGVNFNDIVTMVQTRKLMDGKNVVRTVYDMIKSKFKI